jgi:hypothetical protein
MDDRRPAAGNREAVGLDGARVAAQRAIRCVEGLDLDAGQRLSAFGADNSLAGQYFSAGLDRQIAGRGRNFASHVDDRDDPVARIVQGKGGAVGAVVVGEDGDLLA